MLFNILHANVQQSSFLLFMSMGWDYVAEMRPPRPIAHRKKMSMGPRWNDTDRENCRTRIETCPSATLSTINPTYTDRGASRSPRWEAGDYLPEPWHGPKYSFLQLHLSPEIIIKSHRLSSFVSQSKQVNVIPTGCHESCLLLCQWIAPLALSDNNDHVQWQK
jgi:hypothetical protein